MPFAKSRVAPKRWAKAQVEIDMLGRAQRREVRRTFPKLVAIRQLSCAVGRDNLSELASIRFGRDNEAAQPSLR